MATTLASVFFLALCVIGAYSTDVINWPVPMIHQKWDVPTWYDGSWGCGPTSTVMGISYFGRLTPIPIELTYPTDHTNDYGWYLPNNYTWGDTTFDREQPDASGNPTWGAYGYCTTDGDFTQDVIVFKLTL